jgi:hypothetical protein
MAIGGQFWPQKRWFWLQSHGLTYSTCKCSQRGESKDLMSGYNIPLVGKSLPGLGKHFHPNT